MQYPIQVTKVSDGYRMFCRDVPECDFTKSTLEELKLVTENCIPGFMEEFYRKAKRPIPLPSDPLPGESLVYVSAKLQSKILLWNEICKQGIQLKQLADELGMSKSQVQRLVDFSKSASIDNVEKALLHLGVGFTLTTESH